METNNARLHWPTFRPACLAKATYEIYRSNCATQRVAYNSADDIFQIAQTNPQFMTFRHPMERLVSVWHGRFQQLNGYTVSFSCFGFSDNEI